MQLYNSNSWSINNIFDFMNNENDLNNIAINDKEDEDIDIYFKNGQTQKNKISRGFVRALNSENQVDLLSKLVSDIKNKIIIESDIDSIYSMELLNKYWHHYINNNKTLWNSVGYFFNKKLESKSDFQYYRQTIIDRKIYLENLDLSINEDLNKNKFNDLKIFDKTHSFIQILDELYGIEIQNEYDNDYYYDTEDYKNYRKEFSELLKEKMSFDEYNDAAKKVLSKFILLNQNILQTIAISYKIPTDLYPLLFLEKISINKEISQYLNSDKPLKYKNWVLKNAEEELNEDLNLMVNLNSLTLVCLNLPEKLFEMTNLTKLKILTDYKLKHIIKNKGDISNLINLEKLKIENCIKDYFSYSICSHLKNIKNLSLPNNKIKVIPNEIKNLVHLKKLDFSKNKIVVFSKELCELKNLEDLQLNENNIEFLPVEIENLSNLDFLYLSSNKIKILPKQFWSLTKLSYLYLNANPLISIPCDIKNLTNLQKFLVDSESLRFFPPIKVWESLPFYDLDLDLFPKNLIAQSDALLEELENDDLDLENKWNDLRSSTLIFKQHLYNLNLDEDSEDNS